MKQSQRVRIIVSPTGNTGQITFYTTVKEVKNTSYPVRETFAELEKSISAFDSKGIVSRHGGWDVQIDLV